LAVLVSQLNTEISESVMNALRAESERSGSSISEVVDRMLSRSLELERHSLFQVSTSNALVEGVFEAAVTVGDLKRHGDFGLGTFEDLDGELIMLDGECYRATAEGVVTIPDDADGTPFAVVTEFTPDIETQLDSVLSLDELESYVDELRPSGNLFVGIRGDGVLGRVSLRAACRAARGEGLLDATGHQSEFDATEVAGTLVGFWAPEYSRSVAVPGYHFHFITADRSLGGHVLDLAVKDLDLTIHIESDLHIALPESAAFLTADLSGDHSEELEVAETGIRTEPRS
jgi:acetolactate decarboxylase